MHFTVAHPLLYCPHMEQGFQSLLLTGIYEVGDRNVNFSPLPISGHTYMTTEINSQNYDYTSAYDNTFNQNIIHSPKTCESSSNKHNKPTNLKRLKTDPETTPYCLPPTNMFSYSQLPDLQSLEHVNNVTNFQLTPEPETTSFFTFSPINLFCPLPELRSTEKISPSPAKDSGTYQAYRRRQKISAKTQSLQRLLPVEKKMDIATIYEEAYKYIVFLKAQITALECMPVTSSCSGSSLRCGNPRYIGLEKLNRQQLLEVVVNSPVAQSVMYTKGCCVYSLEQLMLFNDVVQKRYVVFSDFPVPATQR